MSEKQTSSEANAVAFASGNLQAAWPKDEMVVILTAEGYSELLEAVVWLETRGPCPTALVRWIAGAKMGIGYRSALTMVEMRTPTTSVVPQDDAPKDSAPPSQP